MRILLLVIGIAGLLLGATILLYDAYFFRRFGVDMNDVLGTDGVNTIDWETGTRPTYANFPAWHYGIAFMLIAAVILTVLAFLPRRSKFSRDVTSAHSV
jgi:hypothetical protein